MPDYPASALDAAERAIIEAATDFGQDNIVAGPSCDLARAALEAAAPILADARGEIVKTEWGVRYAPGKVGVYGTGPDNERHARMDADGPLVRRAVTYGPWEEVSGEQP